MKKYPGQDFAEQHGYHLYSHSPGAVAASATYIKNEIGFKIIQRGKELEGELFFTWKSLTIHTGRFAIPGNFDIFENHITQAVLILFS